MAFHPVRPHFWWICRLGSPLLLALSLWAGSQPVQVDELALGERMYREGILPSGAPMTILLRVGSKVEGLTFSCAGCHLRAGVGSAEGMAAPSINAEKLYRPLYRFHPALIGEERRMLPDQTREVLRRPAYTDEALARAITQGVDPTGRILSDAMPRYAMSPEEIKFLVRYLKTLSASPSPGVTPTTLHFATILTEEVSVEDRSDLLGVLRHRIQQHNKRGEHREAGGYRALAAREGALAFRDWSLSVWELKGPSRSWAAQLEAYLKRDPAFAILSGLSYGPWEPIQAFCETHRLPCLFPVTDLPPTQGPGWYTLYFSKGLSQEGEAAAAYLAGQVQGTAGRPILQVVADTLESRALAKGFDHGWADHDQPEVRTLHLARGARPNLQGLLEGMKGQGPPILLLWTGPEAYAGMARLTLSPGTVIILSSSLLGRKLWDLPQGVRDWTLLTYPYRLFRPPADRMGGAAVIVPAPSQLRLVAGDTHRRIRSRAFAAMKSLEEVVSHMGRNFYRDHLLDGFGQLMDDQETDYERLSFGPGQRFASKGCYVVRMPKGTLHGFLQESDWEIR